MPGYSITLAEARALAQAVFDRWKKSGYDPDGLSQAEREALTGLAILGDIGENWFADGTDFEKGLNDD